MNATTAKELKIPGTELLGSYTDTVDGRRQRRVVFQTQTPDGQWLIADAAEDDLYTRPVNEARCVVVYGPEDCDHGTTVIASELEQMASSVARDYLQALEGIAAGEPSPRSAHWPQVHVPAQVLSLARGLDVTEPAAIDEDPLLAGDHDLTVTVSESGFVRIEAVPAPTDRQPGPLVALDEDLVQLLF